MPRRLPDRCAPDSVREFHAASLQRSQDAASLALNGRRTAAVYLWGYASEMLLKAAYFRLLGYDETQEIRIRDLTSAAAGTSTVGVNWPTPSRLHNVRLWAELLVNTRASRADWAYHEPSVGSRVLSYGFLVERVWKETLRYHKNVAYPHEVRQAREAAEWLLLNYPGL